MAETKIHSNCPSCGKLLSGATSLNEEDALPSPGDISVCMDCATILKFDNDLRLVAISNEEFAGYPEDIKKTVKKARNLLFDFNIKFGFPFSKE